MIHQRHGGLQPSATPAAEDLGPRSADHAERAVARFKLRSARPRADARPAGEAAVLKCAPAAELRDNQASERKLSPSIGSEGALRVIRKES